MSGVLDGIFAWLGSARFNGVTPSLVSGESCELQCDSSGRLLVNLDQPGTSWNAPGTASSHRVVKTANGKLYRVWGTNQGVTDRYVFLFNASSLPANGSSAEIVPPIKVAAGTSFEVDFGLRPYVCSAGITWVVSSSPATLTEDTGSTFAVATEYT